MKQQYIKFNTSRKKNIVASINITPFVDALLIMFVLFFSLFAASMFDSMSIELPKNNVQKESVNFIRGQSVLVTVNATGKIAINDKICTKNELLQMIMDILKNKTGQDRLVFLKADSKTEYGTISAVIAAAKNSQSKIAFITDNDRK